jgi:hypothetical protein
MAQHLTGKGKFHTHFSMEFHSSQVWHFISKTLHFLFRFTPFLSSSPSEGHAAGLGDGGRTWGYFGSG